MANTGSRKSSQSSIQGWTSLSSTEPVPSAPRVRRQGNRFRIGAVVVVVALALGFLLSRGLGDATLYFRTADEAVAQRQELGERRFRIEGTVVPGSIRNDGELLLFSIASKGVTVPVQNSGQPLGLFQENIPVVLEGHFAGNSDTFRSDRILVRHSADYESDYPERVSGAANS